MKVGRQTVSGLPGSKQRWSRLEFRVRSVCAGGLISRPGAVNWRGLFSLFNRKERKEREKIQNSFEVFAPFAVQK
jgi:hypothetical protein